MDARTRQNVMGVALIIAALAIILYAVKPYLPDFILPPELPGENPPTTLQTTVKLKLLVPGGDPDIVSIYTEKVSTSLRSEKAELMIFPWGGKLTLEVIAPDGSEVSITKDVKIDVGETKDYYFTWKTRQTGRHILIVSLINGEGVVVKQRQSEVWV